MKRSRLEIVIDFLTFLKQNSWLTSSKINLAIQLNQSLIPILLKQFLEKGFIEKQPVKEGMKSTKYGLRYEYRITEKGRQFIDNLLVSKEMLNF